MTAPIVLGLQVDQHLKANASRVALAFASGLRPPPRISVAEWAAQYRTLPEDSAYAGRWKHKTAPYLFEIMEKLSPHDPVPEVAIIKCAQSGGSASAENLIGYIADIAPGPTMYVQATIKAAQDWLAEKFWPMVEATRRLNPRRKGAIMAKRARDGEGTTALRVRYRRGSYMLIAGANSAATLRQHSIRYVVEDDLDQFPDDLDNQGSPEDMVTARLTVYTRQGLAKRCKISTPTNKGASKIERAYEASDKRRYYFKCPHCGDRFDPVFEDLEWPKSPLDPTKAYLNAPCCGTEIHHWQKPVMSLLDGWLATVEISGEKPSRVLTEDEFQQWKLRDLGGLTAGYSIGGIITSFLTWGDLCARFVAAQGDINRLRSWTNLFLGEAFAIKGDAPAVEDLELLKEQDWGKDQVPYGPCIFTLGCDVQGEGIYYEALGWYYGLENWSLDHGFIPGRTDVAGEGAWAKLEAYAKRTFVMPGGKAYGFDQICVDAGYNTEAVKVFCARSANRMPVFGRAGWNQPILGRGQAIHVDRFKPRKAKRRKKPGEEAYLVGTFGAKLSFYGHLRTSIETVKDQLNGQRPEARWGRCHFGRDATNDYFEMLTSESCIVEMKHGQPTRVWKVEVGKQNHWLDCRIYNRAAAEAISLTGFSEHDWLVEQGKRYAAKDPAQGDLLALMTQPIQMQAETPNAPKPQPVVKPVAADPVALPATEGWIEHRQDWI